MNLFKRCCCGVRGWCPDCAKHKIPPSWSENIMLCSRHRSCCCTDGIRCIDCPSHSMELVKGKKAGWCVIHGPHPGVPRKLVSGEEYVNDLSVVAVDFDQATGEYVVRDLPL